MELEKHTKQPNHQENQLQPNSAFSKQLVAQTTFPSEFLTPKITNKMRKIIDDFRQTRRIQMKKKIYGGESKWIFKTQMMVVSQSLPLPISQAYSKEATLTKLKTYIKVSQNDWQKESQRLQDKKAKFQQLLQTFNRFKAERAKLKKKVVYCYIKNMNIKFLVNKNNEIDAQLQQSKHQIELVAARGQMIKSELNSINSYQSGLEEYRMKKLAAIEGIAGQIAAICEEIKAKDQKIREISIKRLPNQKDICCCMFSVGILNEQIYILQLKKLLKKQITSSDLQLRKIKNDGKQKAALSNTFSTDLSDHILNRKIKIDCRGSQIVVFKVFTVIYMHCQTLELKNVSSLMSKTSFFSQQFQHIYDFKQFEKYMINLIERFKGNQTLRDLGGDPENCSCSTLFVVTNQPEFRYLGWILKGFDYVSENKFCVRIGQNKTYISLILPSELVKIPTKDKQAILKVKFCELNKTSAFD